MHRVELLVGGMLNHLFALSYVASIVGATTMFDA